MFGNEERETMERELYRDICGMEKVLMRMSSYNCDIRLYELQDKVRQYMNMLARYRLMVSLIF